MNSLVGGRTDLWIVAVFIVIIALVTISRRDDIFEDIVIVIIWIIAIPMNIAAALALVAFAALMVVIDIVVFTYCWATVKEYPESQTAGVMSQLIDVFDR